MKLLDSSLIATCALSLLICDGREARADNVSVLKYSNGPILNNFTICPIFYGDWSSFEARDEMEYLYGLAEYISGQKNPAGMDTMLRQYGVTGAGAISGVSSSVSGISPRAVAPSEIPGIIMAAQNNHTTCGGFGPRNLFIVFLAHGFRNNGACGPLCGYHTVTGGNQYWGVVPADTGPSLAAVSAHEVFEAATNPDTVTSWIAANNDEAVDNCSPFFNVTHIRSDTGAPMNMAVPGAHDNTQNGVCSSSGFTPRLAAPTTCGLISGGSTPQALISGTGQDRQVSCNGLYTLILQTNGELIIQQSGGGVIWRSNRSGSTAIPYSALMQSDGNFVVYQGLGINALNKIWATDTFNFPGANIFMQVDGNLVVYDTNGVVRFHSR